MIEIKCVGRLTKDIEFSQDNDECFAKGCVATNERIKMGDKSWQETIFLHFVIEGELAETMRHAKKGDGVRMHGYLTQRQHTDKQGRKHTRFVVLVEYMKILDKEVFDYIDKYRNKRELKPPQSKVLVYNDLTGEAFEGYMSDGRIATLFKTYNNEAEITAELKEDIKKLKMIEDKKKEIRKKLKQQPLGPMIIRIRKE